MGVETTRFFEYRVVERSEDGTSWYDHGYKGHDEAKAWENLEHMEETYGKYGRVFRLEYRKIGAWYVLTQP